MRVSLTTRRSKHSIIKEINSEIFSLILKLKLQYFGHLIQRTDSLEKTLMLEKIESGRIRMNWLYEMVGWHDQLDGHEFEEALRLSNGQGSLACCSPWSLKELDTTEQLN